MNFPGRSEVVPIRTQRVPQAIETPVSFVSAPGAYVRYAYSRSSDSMNSQGEGQDYLCFQHNDQRLVFVVCDGVGSSFCGNLAARILGDLLREWLWSQDIAYFGGASALQEAATSYLNRIQKQAQMEVNEYEIPGEMSGLVRQALEAQRAYGSEAIFAAARIDHPSPMFPDGLISVLWMGDTRIHVLDEGGKEFELGGSWDNANRWSTVHGARGRMTTWMRELDGVARVVAHTDGLSAHTVKIFDYGDAKLDREIHAGSKLATSDDVAFIDVVLRTPVYEGQPDPELPDPNEEYPRLEQIWNPTGADTYELRWNWPGSDKDRFILQEATNPALSDARLIEVAATGVTSWRPPSAQAPGHYYYRVRAIKRHGSMTPWSELRQTKVAYPPPPAPTLTVNGDKNPVLAWSEEGETLDYTLEQSRDPNFAEPETVYSGRGTSWSVPTSGMKPGKIYYRVRAASSGGPSPWSAVQEITITVPPPPRPTLSIGRYGHAQGPYELRWQPVLGAVRYELQRREEETGAEEIIELDDNIYVVPELETGRYLFAVRACNQYVCSEWSNEQRIDIAPEAPDEAPTLTLHGPDEDGRARVEWTSVPGAEGYIVETSAEDDFFNARVQRSSEQPMEFQRREPGSLFVRVCGTNRGGNGPWSNVVAISIDPDAPGWMETKLSDDAERISATWGAVGGRVSYTLEMAADSGEFHEVYSGTDTTFEMDTLPEADSVRFRVRAEVPGRQSAWWTGEALTLRAGPAAPVLEPPIMEERSAVRLRWKPVEGAIHYILEASRDESFSYPQAAAPMNATEILFHPPTSGVYWFRIKAASQTRVSKPGNPVSINVRQPSPPRLWPVDPVTTRQSFEAAWKGMPGIVYYELQVSRDPSFPPDQTQASRVFHPAQKLGISGQPTGTVYLRVRSVDGDSQTSLWSDTLSVEIK